MSGPVEQSSSGLAVLLARCSCGSTRAGRNGRPERRAKAEKNIDAQVLQALGNSVMNSRQIAESLGLDQDDVADSLERLEARGKAKRSSGTFSDPAPSWLLLHR